MARRTGRALPSFTPIPAVCRVGHSAVVRRFGAKICHDASSHIGFDGDRGVRPLLVAAVSCGSEPAVYHGGHLVSDEGRIAFTAPSFESKGPRGRR